LREVYFERLRTPTTQRFSMRLPITVRWTTGAAVGETSTESRDVSSRGVYFFLAKDVKEGSQSRFF